MNTSLLALFPGLDHPIILEVEPMALNGAFNQLFMVQASCKSWEKPIDLCFRFTIPVNPWYKTHAEVATMMYVRHYTTVPVPRIYAFDSSSRNPLGFEWMLMERVPGSALKESDGTPESGQLQTMTKQVAEYLTQLPALPLPGEGLQFGSIYYNWRSQIEGGFVNKNNFYVGQISSYLASQAERIKYPLHRGPYNNVSEMSRFYLEIGEAAFLDDGLPKVSAQMSLVVS